jgi:hypothetical protein
MFDESGELSDLANYQSAAIATVNPNPTIPNSNSSGTLADFTQLANVAGQWGATIASMFGGSRPTVVPQGTGLASANSTSNTTMTLLLFGVVILGVVLVVKK